MEFKLEQITPAQLEEFIESPKKASEWVNADSSDDPTLESSTETTSEENDSFLAEAFARLDDLTGLSSPASQSKAGAAGLSVEKNAAEPQEATTKVPRKRFFLEKDWHVLHYALCGQAEAGEDPISQAVIGGREIPDRHGAMGYGTVQYLRPEEVQEVAKALESVDAKQLTSKLDQKDAAEKNIYLAHTFDNPSNWAYLPSLFEEFRRFYREAAVAGNALILQKY